MADLFSELPIHYLRFFGATDVARVLDAMDYACYAYDVTHIILDNLQFMLSNLEEPSSKFGKFDMQDRCLLFPCFSLFALPELILELSFTPGQFLCSATLPRARTFTFLS